MRSHWRRKDAQLLFHLIRKDYGGLAPAFRL